MSKFSSSKAFSFLPEELDFNADPLDYSEQGFSDGESVTGEFLASKFRKASLPKPPSFVPKTLLGAKASEDFLDFSEKGLPDSDMTYDQVPFPWLEKAGQKSAKKQKKPKHLREKKLLPMPDISSGMGQSQVKKELSSLTDYVKSNQEWIVHEAALYRYNQGAWEKLDKPAGIRAIKEIFLGYKDVVAVLSERDYREIYERLLTDPVLFHPEALDYPDYLLNCLDGVLDLSKDPPEKIPHDPEYGFQSVLNLCCDEILAPPMAGDNFESFAMKAGNGDPEVRRQLLELTALALTGCQLKHFFVLLGPSDSGKSQWGRFLLELLGKDNVGTVRDIDDFGDKWTVGSLAGKQLGLCMDLPNRPLSKAAIGILKQFCGADAVKAELKYANSFTYYHKPLMLLAGNHPIQVPQAEREEAFLNRMVIIPFATSVQGAEKVQDFYQVLLEEAPYIVHEAIVAYQDLIARNYELTRVAVPKEYQPQEGNSLYGSISDFVAQYLMEESDAEITTNEIYDTYCACVDDDVSKPVFAKVLSQVLSRVIPEATPVKRVDGTDLRGYKNLAFVSEL